MSTTYNEAATAASTNSTARVATASIVGNGHRVLRLLYLCHCGRASDRPGVLPADLRHGADARVVPDLRHRVHRPPAGFGAVRPLWRPWPQIDAGGFVAADGGAYHADRLVPLQDSIGAWVPILLCVLRFGQGLAGRNGAVRRCSPPRTRRRANARGSACSRNSVPSIGFLAANGLFLIPAMNLNDEQFRSWGWRIPFILSAARW